MKSIGNDKFPWVIQATLNYTSNPSTQLIIETEANVVNGFANFTKLGISEVTENLAISYKFKVPQGVDQ